MASSSTRSAAAFIKSSASIRAASTTTSDRDKNRIPQQTTTARDPKGTGGGDVRLDTQGNATIRRRIPAFTLVLGPLPLHTTLAHSGGAVSNDAAAVTVTTVFTDDDATLVRNTIETLITTYLVTEQPWAAQIREDDEDGTSLSAGSVTSVGLTNSVDSRLVPEEEDSVAVTMQGLIYFASGLGGGATTTTPNIPEEADILQTLEDVILVPAVVLAALQQEFPAVQSVTIGDNTLTTLPATPSVEPEPKPTPATEVAPAPSTATAAAAVARPSWAPSTVASIGTETTSASAVINENGTIAHTTNMAGVVGGIVAGVAVVIVVLGMWMVRTKRRQKKKSPHRRGSGNDDIQYLVEVGSKDGLKLAYDWKSNSNKNPDGTNTLLPSPTGTDATVPASPHEFVDRTIRNTDDDDDNDDDDARKNDPEDMERGRSVVLTSPSEVSKTREAGTTAEASQTHTTTSGLGESTLNYLSSFFAKSTTPALAHDDVHSVSAIAIDRGSTGEMQGAENLKSVVSDLDGTSVSMSVPTLPSTADVLTLESFEEQHQTLQRESRGMNGGIGGVKDRKEMLESSFGKISRALSLSGKEYFNAGATTNTNTALNLSPPPPLERSHSDVSSNLSYSSSSMSSIGDQYRREGKGRTDRSHGHKKKKNRKKGVVRTTALKREVSPGGTMMPNPYFGGGNRSPDRDRRTTYPGLLAPTDTTAAALAGPSRRRATATSDPGSSNSGLGMRVPKLSSPLAWLNNAAGNTGGGGRSSSSSSSKKIRSFSNNSKRASRTSNNSRTGSQTNVIRSRSSGSGSRRSKAVEDAFKDEGYSGDEENNLETDGSTTFGAPSSDGWDPTDVLADLGANDDPDDERNHMRLFRKNGNHTGSNQLPSLLNTTTTSSSYRKKNNGGSSSFRKSSSSTKELQKLNELLPPKHPSWNQNDDTDSLFSEESNVLKFVSSVDMSVDMEI